MKTIKAIKFNCETQTIEEIELNGSLEDFYKHIGNNCSLMEVGLNFDYKGVRNSVLIDEEGRINNSPIGGVVIGGCIFVGNALIVGYDKEGESISTNISVEEAESDMYYEWISKEDSEQFQF
jgi:hypothetical protein